MTARPSTRMPRFDSQSGFTLMEIAIVMALIATLAGVGLSMAGNSVTRAKEATPRKTCSCATRSTSTTPTRTSYPPTLEALADKYPRAIPVDPFTLRMDTWKMTMSGARRAIARSTT